MTNPDRPLEVCKHCHFTLDKHVINMVRYCIYEPMDNFELVEFYENRDTLRDWYTQCSKSK